MTMTTNSDPTIGPDKTYGLSFTPRESGVRIPHRSMTYGENRKSGIQTGILVSDPPAKGVEIACGDCGAKYFVLRVRPDRPSHRCKTCRSRAAIAKAHAKFTSPASSRAQRVRANGLINKRLKLGWFTKPTRCCKCDRSGCRIVSHHPDYDRPAEVYWICDGCHGSVHHDPAFLAGIPVFVCGDMRADADRPKPHGRGGRSGPLDGKALDARRAAVGKINLDEAREIRDAVKNGDDRDEIARRFGIHVSSVNKIARGSRWRDDAALSPAGGPRP